MLRLPSPAFALRGFGGHGPGPLPWGQGGEAGLRYCAWLVVRMNERIQRKVCAEARERKLFTNEQYEILCALCDEHVPAPEYFEMVRRFGIASDAAQLEQVVEAVVAREQGTARRTQVSATPATASSPAAQATTRASRSAAPVTSSSPAAQAAPQAAGPTVPVSSVAGADGATDATRALEAEWFFFYAVSQGLLTPEACRGLVPALGEKPELSVLVEAAAQLGVFANELERQVFTDAARSQARSGAAPPRRPEQGAASAADGTHARQARASQSAAVPAAQPSPQAPVAAGPAGQPSSGREAQSGASASSGLSEAHRLIPFLSRSDLYDTVTQLYLDAVDEAGIAQDLTARYGIPVTSAQVREIRLEAAAAAERLATPEEKRKWIYRYRVLTVNNVVKEYMFLTGAKDFLTAKRELAGEIASLVREIPENRLLLAVNEALGRSNIDRTLIAALAAYDAGARKLERTLQGYAESNKQSLADTLVMLAEKLETLPATVASDGTDTRARYLARLVGVQTNLFTAEDVAFLLEYRRAARIGGGEGGLTQRLMRGADIVARRPPEKNELRGRLKP